MKRFEGEYDEVRCEINTTPYGNTRADNLQPGEMDCRFSDEGSDNSLYGSGGSARTLGSLEVDGSVNFRKDFSGQETVVKKRQEKLKVYKDPVGKLVVTTESAEQMEGREEGEMSLPGERSIRGDTIGQGDVVTHLGCLTDLNDDGEIVSDCAVATRDGEFKSASNVQEVNVSGDVDIVDNARDRGLDVRPRTSIVESSVAVNEDTGNIRLDLADRRRELN